MRFKVIVFKLLATEMITQHAIIQFEIEKH